MVDILNMILLAAIIVISLYRWFVYWQGGIDVRIGETGRSKLEVISQTDKQVTLQCQVEMANHGKQIAILLDCFTRHLLPYEQYDGVKLSSRLMRSDAVREDDYFEAYLLKQNKKIDLFIELTFTARRDESIQQALSQMVDVPVEIIYEVESRLGLKHEKHRLEFTAEEIAAAAGAVLQK